MSTEIIKKKTLKTLNHLTRAYIIIGVAIVLIIIVSVVFIASFRSELYKQRSYSLGQTTEKIVQITDSVIMNEWERLSFISYELSREPQESTAKLLERLAEFARLESQKYKLEVSCIDSEGNLYQWNGKIGRWSLPSMLLEGLPSYQVTLMESSENNSEQMAFLYTLPERIKLVNEDIELTHTLLYLDMEVFGAELEVSSFEGKSYSYITEQNGTKLYHQKNQGEFISAYNILSTLKQVKFLHDESFEKLIQSTEEDYNYVAEIEYEGENYFVSYSVLSINNWKLFIFVPEAGVSGNTASLIGNMLFEVTIIALFIVVMISIFVWNNAQQTLAKQQIAVDEAHKASKAKSDFLSHMSHDIRTPLNGIIGMCHIAEQKIGDEKGISDCLEKINLSSRQLMALINDVLDMSRIEQGKVEMNHFPVDLIDLLNTCTIHTEVPINEKGITFKQDISGIVHRIVSTDEVIIEKIITNILGNASKFTGPGGMIELTVSETNVDSLSGIYIFIIKDNGIGMSEEFVKHIFEPFSQEKVGSRTRYQGTGLGLSIVKNLVDQLGGTIEVESQENVGSTFIVSLPLKYADEKTYFSENKDDKEFNGKGLRVLLVEDNELNSMIAQSILEESGLFVDTASNGAIAVEKFENSPLGTYDIILMDVRMPVMDGLEASRQIRSLYREDANEVPIIALSADAFSEDMNKTRLAGMDAHLSKPIDIEKLHAILKKFCSKDNKV